MINCFYWYSIIWSSVIILYSMGLSSFNEKLSGSLVVFLLFTVFCSFIIGYFNRKTIKISKECYCKIPLKYLIFCGIGFTMDFLYARQIPLINILSKKNNYGDFEGIPVIHVLIIGFASYLSLRYMLNIVFADNKKDRKENTSCFFFLNAFFALSYYRAMIIFQLFALINCLLYKYRINHKIGVKKIITSIVVTLLILYIYGGVGNLRDGYSFMDNSYIERIGHYDRYPNYIPKQYMWAYSYLTSTLANLNYNVLNNSSNIKLENIKFAVFPDFIAKRLNNDGNYNYSVKYQKEYFNAVTGWANLYINGGFILLYIYFCFIMMICVWGLQMTKKKKNYNSGGVYICVTLVMTTFMFFYNTFTYAGTFIPFIISLFCLFPKITIK